ncbi:hypothetical protein F5Y04DRAFT_10804 [Hypomontagnella monticulosa]|nr:hypothetical protein F5Y04DRAFT_10804 [Hypomontagnella monticulosa]
MEFHPDNQILGVESLAGLSLKDLESKISQLGPSKVSRHWVLQTLMRWLHEQIKRDIEDKSSLSNLVDLLLIGGKLLQQPFSEGEVEAAFGAWQIRDAAENPANRRRYEMVRLDLLVFLKKPSGNMSFDDNSTTMKSRKLSNIDRPDDPINDQRRPWWNGGKQRTGSNEIPLGKKKALHDSYDGKTSETEGKKSKQTSTWDMPPTKRTAEQTSSSDMSLPGSSPVRTFESSRLDQPTPNQFALPPPYDGYVCQRCHKPGHWVRACPTSLDPAFDRPPRKEYQCTICGKFGVHYITLCPQNTCKDSLTQQRKLHAQLEASSLDHGSRYQDRPNQSPLPRYRSRSPMDRRRIKGRDIQRPDDNSQDWTHSSDSRHHQSSDRGSVSPWTARQRKTRELHRRGEALPTYTSDMYRPRRTSASPPRSHRHSHRAREVPPQEYPRQLIELSTTEEDRKGRLAYDNGDFSLGWNDDSPTTPSSPKKKNRGDVKINEDVEMADAPLVTQDITETEQAMKEADDFLDRLAIELDLKNEITQPTLTLTLNQRDPNSVAVGQTNADQDEDTGEKTLAFSKGNGQVSRGKLGPENLPLLHLLHGRKNPAVHNAKRMTAVGMMALDGPTDSPTLLNTGEPEQH